jgi:hypothetical protein
MDLEELEPDDNDRKKSLTGVRLFKDQLEALRWLSAHKYRNNRKPAELIRDAVDQFIDREKLSV